MSTIPQPTQQAEGLPSTGQAPGSKRAQTPGGRYQSLEGGTKFPQLLLNVGFGFALLLSAACFSFSAYYLFTFLTGTSAGVQGLIDGASQKLPAETLEVAISARLYMARLALFSCGVFIGVAFGFLGFALFLLGIRENVDASAGNDSLKARFARLSPGLLVILCATVLISICITRPVTFEYHIRDAAEEDSAAPGAAAAPTPNLPAAEQSPTP